MIFYVFFLCMVSVTLSPVAAELCCVCENCGIAAGRENVFLDSKGTTCLDRVMTAASSYQEGSSGCATARSQLYDTCCTTNKAYTPVVQAPPADPCLGYPTGNNPTCNLCHDGAFPSKPTTAVAVLGVTDNQSFRNAASGSPTCKSLYCWSKRGNISPQLCAPMQDYMDIPCGCYSRFAGQNAATPTYGGDTGYVPSKQVNYAPNQDDVDKDDVDRLADKDRKRGSARKLKGT